MASNLNCQCIMKTILVPTDFSKAAHNASQYAVDLAKALNYKVLLVHIYNAPVLAEASGFSTSEYDEPSENETIYTQKLEQKALQLAKSSGVIVDFNVTSGFTLDKIHEIEEKIKPNLIVVGLKPDGEISEYLFGSITGGLVKNTTTPVLIVPEGSVYEKIDKIAFTSDLKMECDMCMHEPLEDLIKAHKSKISILNIVKEQADKIGKDDGISGKRIERYFENKVHMYHFLENNDIIAGINEFIVNQDIDMITMIPQKRNLIERLFKESNTMNMAFHIDVPLLTLPAIPC